MDTPGEFDVVILSHVIEHLHDPVALLKMCHLLLEKNGLLVLLTPNVASYGHRKFGAGWCGLESPRHIHLFTCKNWFGLLKNLALVIQILGRHRSVLMNWPK